MKQFASLLAKLNFDAGGDSDIAGRIRAYQIDSIARVTPLMMIANAANAAIMVAWLYPKTGSVFLLVWAVAICGMAAFWLATRNRKPRQSPIVRASRRGIVRTTLNALLLGALWGVLPAVIYPGSDAEVRLMLSAVIAGMLGGGCLVLYVVPPAMFAWVGALASGAFYAVLSSGTGGDLAVAALLLVFSVTLLRSGHAMAQVFNSSRKASLQVKDQATTIAMLLNDFSEGTRDWLWETDSQGRITRGGEHFLEHGGFRLESLKPDALTAGGEGNTIVGGHKTLETLWASFRNMQPFDSVLFQVRTDGKDRWISLSGKPILEDDGGFQGFRGVASDITEQKEAEERVAYLAYNDALTGLVNRATFRSALDTVAKSGDHPSPAIFYLDLDGFKPVNDTYGHDAGDRLLVEIGQRLRRAAGDNDIVARLGGDEFAVLARSATTTQSASALAENLLEAIGAPVAVEGNVMEVGASIGIAFAGHDGEDANRLLHNADLALYRAKSESRGAFRFYEIEMDDVVRQRRTLENDLREAVRTGALTLAFQPLIDADSSATTGFEALVRWNHRDHGDIPPADFIPVAERIGLISQIGQTVLMEACKAASQWPNDLKVAVNLSPQQFRDGCVVDHVKWALEMSGLEPGRLELEITESLFIQNTDDVLTALAQLKAIGVSLALDDFGTGYSSLSYLLKFPFDKLKIDRTFIASMEEDNVARDVLEAITKLGRILNLSVTAEGVETPDQAESLKAMSCTHFQGFHFGRPLNPVDLSAYLLNEFKQQTGTLTAVTKPARSRRKKKTAEAK